MQDETRRREARMMAAVAGLGGRSALSAEVDLRLGVRSDMTSPPRWLAAPARCLRRLFGGTVAAQATDAATPGTAPGGATVGAARPLRSG
jgi:hypothetical protein